MLRSFDLALLQLQVTLVTRLGNDGHGKVARDCNILSPPPQRVSFETVSWHEVNLIQIAQYVQWYTSEYYDLFNKNRKVGTCIVLLHEANVVGFIG